VLASSTTMTVPGAKGHDALRAQPIGLVLLGACVYEASTSTPAPGPPPLPIALVSVPRASGPLLCARPLAVRLRVPPRRLAWHRGAAAVLEIPSPQGGESAAAELLAAVYGTSTTHELVAPAAPEAVSEPVAEPDPEPVAALEPIIMLNPPEPTTSPPRPDAGRG
jgi:hypothetical protein